MKSTTASCPFVIVRDSAETHPFSFQGFRADSRQQYKPLVVETVWGSLGRHPHGLGDYSIQGLEQLVAVERKSIEDCWSTVMGWEGTKEKQRGTNSRRERFKQELSNLSDIQAGAVVVEGSFGHCVKNVPEWGSKTDATNQKIFFRSVLALQQDFRVPWLFCDTRRMAEQATFRWLERFFRHHQKDCKDDMDEKV